MSPDNSSPRSAAETLRTALLDFLASPSQHDTANEGDDMTRQRFDHSQCQHPKTKAGRAGCRKAHRAAAEPAEQKPGTPAAKKTAAKPAAKKTTAPKSPDKAADNA
jgi:hypothetical protein